MYGIDSGDKSLFLLELYRKALSLPDEELYTYFLDHAVNATNSAIGFFHFVSDDQKSIMLTTWNREALKTCSADYSTHYPIERAGNWADCVRLKRPIVYNDFRESPNQKGLPKGHVTIKRILSVPIVEEGRTQAIFGVGNKTEQYVEHDLVQLDLIANELNKILKQRKAERELRDAKEKYYSLFANMLDGFAYCEMIFDNEDKPVDFVYLEVNDAFEMLTGLKREMVVGKKVTEVIPDIEKTNSKLFEIYGRVALGGKEERFELFFEPLNIWLSISAYCPKKGYFAAVFENITQRKQAQEALIGKEKKYRRLFETSQDGIMARDLQGRMIDCNQAYSKIVGYTREELLSLMWHQLLPEKWHKQRERIANEVIENGGSFVFEREYRRKDGSVFPASVRTWRLTDENGQIIGTWSIVRDITELKKTEDALRESEQRLKRSEEIAHLGSWELDLITNELLWSDEVYRIYGLKPQEFGATYEAFLESVHPDDRAAVDSAYSKSIHEGKDSYEIEHRIIRRDSGEVRIVHEKCTHIKDSSGIIIKSIGMVHDVTEQKQLQSKLEEYAANLENLVKERTKQLKESERMAAIGATAGMVGHDIRNPLQAIIGDLYLARTDLASLPDSEEKNSLKESLVGIERNIEYINKIVQDLQDYARPIKPAAQDIDLESLCEDVLFTNGGLGKIHASCWVERNAKKIITDPEVLKRILTNLVNNAVQAMPEGGKIKLHAYEKSGETIIALHDTGAGIPEEVKPKLFTPLFTTKSKGQGFGLAVVKRMTEALGGKVTYESEVGEGTTFFIHLPLPKIK